jgi:hypothetical protein
MWIVTIGVCIEEEGYRYLEVNTNDNLVVNYDKLESKFRFVKKRFTDIDYYFINVYRTDFEVIDQEIITIKTFKKENAYRIVFEIHESFETVTERLKAEFEKPTEERITSLKKKEREELRIKRTARKEMNNGI